MSATIRVSLEASTLAQDNGATMVFIVDAEGSRFACRSKADIADLAPIYVPGNFQNSKVLGEAFAAFTRLELVRAGKL